MKASRAKAHLQLGSDHPGVVPGHFVPAEVVRQDENDIWLLCLSSNQLGETAESQAETPHRSETISTYVEYYNGVSTAVI